MPEAVRRPVSATKASQQDANCSAGEQSSETPAEMAARVHQVISVIADAVLKLAYERFGPDLGKLEEKRNKSRAK